MVTCDFGAIDGNAGVATANVTFRASGKIGTTIENTAGVARATPALTASAATRIKKTDRAPVAKDGTLTTNENTAASGNLKASDPDGDSLTFRIIDKPAHGTVALDDASKGSYTYTPDQDYSGADRFTFKADDGTLDSNKASVSITVKAVNNPPVAQNGTLETVENTAAAGALSASDPDGGVLTFRIVAQPEHGSVTLDDAAIGAYTYTPATGYSGADSFTFKASDGAADSNTAKISITVKKASGGDDSGGGAGTPLGLGLLALFAAFGVWLKKRSAR